MEYEASMHDVLERLLHDEGAEPRELPLSLLRAITNNFDEAHKIGEEDGFFVLYKGVLRKGKVAVKKLSLSPATDAGMFDNELSCHMRVRHKNIVRLLGYCADTQGKALTHEGNFFVAELRHRLLCFEYPTGGTLAGYISDASHGLSWRKRYKIIKGICEGLYYLHQNRTVHLDLKPKNIWLDVKKVPKIHLFCTSRRLEENQTEVREEEIFGTWGYMAPEYLQNGVITLKADLYSLGVLITEMLIGKMEYFVIENILQSWGDRFGTPLEDRRLEQIRVCAEIAKSCLEDDPEKRPDAEHIIEMLVETENTEELTGLEFTESDAQVSLFIQGNAGHQTSTPAGLWAHNINNNNS